jgi:ABC-2 type transport system ATP-binding protein
MQNTPAIEIKGLTKRFGQKVAVDRIDLRVAPGEFFGFLGPNGAGKSTTINMLVGLLHPDAGTASIHGIDMHSRPLEAKQLLGVVPEGMNLYPRLTGREFIRFVGTIYGLDGDIVAKRTEELLDLMDLSADGDKMIIDYSHGMQKKTALAAAIIHSPRVLFLDEPFEGIDAIAKRTIHDILQKIRAKGTTIFFSSHILEVVERLCTRVSVIANGRIVTEGSIEELRQQAESGDEKTLEDIFLRVVGARESDGGKLSWLE